MAITLVPPHVESAVGYGVFHRAMRLVRVRAVWKAAEADVRANVAVVARDLLGNHVPELKLANARRIDHVAAHRQRNQPGDCRRVLSLLIFLTDLADAQTKLRLDRVEERRF